MMQTLQVLLSFISPIIIVILGYIFTKNQKKFENRLSQENESFKANITEGLKKIEHELDKDKTVFNLDAQRKATFDTEQKEGLKVIYEALIKILFIKQNLYLQLSSCGTDKNCLDEQIKKIDDAYNDAQKVIAKHLTFQPQHLTSSVFSFFQYLGQGIIELKKIKSEGDSHYKYAHSAAYVYSQSLAMQISYVQKYLVEMTPECGFQINPHDPELLPMMYCCGIQPDLELLDEYSKVYPSPEVLKDDYNLDKLKEKELLWQTPTPPEALELRKLEEISTSN